MGRPRRDRADRRLEASIFTIPTEWRPYQVPVEVAVTTQQLRSGERTGDGYALCCCRSQATAQISLERRALELRQFSDNRFLASMGAMLDGQAEPPPDRNPSCVAAEESGRRLARAVLESIDAIKLDAVVYPSWNSPPH